MDQEYSINQFVSTLSDGSKEINFSLLEEHFGESIVKILKGDIRYAAKENQKWIIEITYQSKYFITFAFVLRNSTTVYEISKTNKEIIRDCIIGRITCNDILELMNSLHDDYLLEDVDLSGGDDETEEN
ncbi:hypothetical protein [Niallia sp. 03190]|uniref:hypothetical protein n=1 Tax=Niallia sp. 03190 TaxID=3458061 RepID=UPI0040446469